MIQLRTMLNAADNSGATHPDVHQGARRHAAAATPPWAMSSRSASRMRSRAARSRRARCTTRWWCAPSSGVRRAGRLADPLRRQRGGAADQQARADRHAHLRAGDARAAQRAVHEDHLARAGGAVMNEKDPQRRSGGGDRPAATRAGAAPCIEVLADDRVLVESINMVKKHTKPESAGRQAGRHHREGDAAATSPRLRSGTRRPRRAIGSGSRCSRTAARCASSSRTEK